MRRELLILSAFFALFGGVLAAANPEIAIKAIGWLFLAVSPAPLVYNGLRNRQITDLIAFGRRVSAEVTDVERNPAITIQNFSPYRIVAQWHDAAVNTVYVFRSENLWFDPSRFAAKGSSITVFVDPARPKRYFVDTSHLPRVG